MNKRPVKFSLEKQNSQMSLAETASLHLVQCPLTKLGPADPSTGSCRATSGISHSTTLCYKHLASNSGTIGPPSDSDVPQKASLLFMLSQEIYMFFQKKHGLLYLQR